MYINGSQHIINFETFRFRGYVEDGGFDSNGDSVSIFGVTYWQVQTARLAFVVVFEVGI